MNKLLRRARSSSNREEIVKKAIFKQLSHTIKEIHYCAAEKNLNNTANYATEAANALCTSVEAMFLHGLKDSIKYRFKKVVANVGEYPEPNFWAPLLLISHRQVIDQVANLSQISTEVGQCRAWIRLVLNDCQLSSYLLALRQNSPALKSFYKTEAFLRDSELLDVSQRLVEGIEEAKVFTLPYNSSLLNSWSQMSLILAGIPVPALKDCGVAPCDDAAQCLDETSSHLTVDTGSDTASLNSAFSFSSQASGLRHVVALSEDEILKIILQDRSKNKNAPSIPSIQTEDPRSSPEISDTETKNNVTNTKQYTIGNQLISRGGWSFDENPSSGQESKAESPEHHKNEPAEAEVQDNQAVTDSSFKALIDSYSMLSGGYIKTPDIKEVWRKFNTEMIDSTPEEIIADNNNQKENEIQSDVENESEIKTESMADYVVKICQEKGLDAQNFECAGCKEALNITHKLQVCSFTGEYFCDACMSNEKISIPARIIHNWDFGSYPISRKAFDFINEKGREPLIDFKTVNPHIYGAVEQMAVLQSLRNQLNFLRAYLYTCREPVIEELQKQMAPREYMYEHIHQYSISDLYEIQNNQLFHELEKVIAFGKEHVTGCWLCSQKGFFCEICKKPKALFPFDVENVYRCDVCNAVFHKGCLTSNKPCPKCERRKKREGQTDTVAIVD